MAHKLSPVYVASLPGELGNWFLFFSAGYSVASYGEEE